jgi:hypothetical protein
MTFRIELGALGVLALLSASGCGSDDDATRLIDDSQSMVEGPERGVVPSPAHEPNQNSTVGTSHQAITGDQRICSVLVGNDWRDTIIVPTASNWTRATCKSLCVTLGATQVQAGCLSGGFMTPRFGAALNCSASGTPAAPSPNCW